MADTHHRKIVESFFNEVLIGDKTFEIRREDPNDVSFKKGDIIHLHEIDHKKELTGRAVKAKIGTVSSFEQKPCCVVFSLLNVERVS